eukprot:scaffold5060_cov123-Isochrysis_galbana.AAC.14
MQDHMRAGRYSSSSELRYALMVLSYGHVSIYLGRHAPRLGVARLHHPLPAVHPREGLAAGTGVRVRCPRTCATCPSAARAPGGRRPTQHEVAIVLLRVGRPTPSSATTPSATGP